MLRLNNNITYQGDSPLENLQNPYEKLPKLQGTKFQTNNSLDFDRLSERAESREAVPLRSKSRSNKEYDSQLNCS